MKIVATITIASFYLSLHSQIEKLAAFKNIFDGCLRAVD